MEKRYTEEIVQWSIYLATYGVMFEIALMTARYKRANENHDEIHAALNILAFLIAFITDIWYLVGDRNSLFKNIFYTTNFVCIIVINVNVFLQVIFGNRLRNKMRDRHSKSSAMYYHDRNVHKYSGYCLSLLTKLRLTLVSIIELDRRVNRHEDFTYSDYFKIALLCWVIF